MKISKAYVNGEVVRARYELPKSARVTSWGTFYPGANMDGYGTRITTGYLVQLEGESRWRRVYATCYSNVSTMWIIVNKKHLIADSFH